jgi:hypothetical protein
VVLGVAALAMVGTLPGRTQGLGLITEPLLRDLAVDRVRFAEMNLVATLAGSVFCFGIGGLIDRHGSRIVLTALALMLGAVVVAMSSPWGRDAAHPDHPHARARPERAVGAQIDAISTGFDITLENAAAEQAIKNGLVYTRACRSKNELLSNYRWWMRRSRSPAVSSVALTGSADISSAPLSLGSVRG